MAFIGEDTTAVAAVFNRRCQGLFERDGRQHTEREVWGSFEQCPVCGQLIGLMDWLGKKAHVVLCANGEAN